MIEGSLADVSVSLRRWKVIAFGSQVHGGPRGDSDLDVAVEFEESSTADPALAVWLTSADGWRRELAPLIPWAVDLQWQDRQGETGVVSAGLAHGHTVVHERSALSDA